MKDHSILPKRRESFKHCFYLERVFYKSPIDGRKTFRWEQRYNWDAHSDCIEVGHDPREGIKLQSISNGNFQRVLPAVSHFTRKDAIK